MDVAVSVGDVIGPLEASWDRTGQILVAAPDTAAAVALAEQLAGKITVTTDPA